ncbi:MAG: hypothetical protein ACRCXK_09200 [Wohlfahrtiimonas sp.]
MKELLKNILDIVVMIGLFFVIPFKMQYPSEYSSKKYSSNSEISYHCGKIETDNATYTVKIPKEYVFFPFAFKNESQWDPSTWQEKEDPCQFDVRGVNFQYFWPSLAPYNRLPVQEKGQNSDLVQVSLDDDFGQLWKESIEEIYKRFFKNSWFTGQEKEYDIEGTLAEGKYDEQLKLYHHGRNYIKDYFESEPRYRKFEMYWSLNSMGEMNTLIKCEYYVPEPEKVSFSDTRCEQILFMKDKGRLMKVEIWYLGKHLQNWEKITQQSYQFLDLFITKKLK